MKKQLIGALVGGIILFLWQFLSWSMLGVHQSEFRHTPNQDRILEFLGQNLEGEGTYMLPVPPPGTPMDQEQAYMAPYEGKPWAHLTYHKSWSSAMGASLARSIAVNLLAAWLLVWILMQFQQLNMRTAVQGAIVVGLTGYLTIAYLNSIWFETRSMAYLIDAVTSWGLVGLWLGWWLPRR
ncbi:MAG: hypothetical protein RMJ33_12875 [Saprospiraceae bacterium]|nr:hypothetical protein [Saprospiraceae bacterium]MDW8230721.1 hypothetical protein [Saprospiraceae bacterium]